MNQKRLLLFVAFVMVLSASYHCLELLSVFEISNQAVGMKFVRVFEVNNALTTLSLLILAEG